jgi:hypothetical protein
LWFSPQGRKEGRKKRKKPHTLDKDAIAEENQQDSESKVSSFISWGFTRSYEGMTPGISGST